MTTAEPDRVQSAYRERIAGYTASGRDAGRRSRMLSNARSASFMILVAAGLWAELRPGPVPLFVAALAAVAFLAFIILHSRVRRQERRFATLARLNENGLQRLARAWHELPPREAPPAVAARDGVSGLDLFGRPALVQLMGPAATPQGAQTLAEMLLSADTAQTIRSRQDAVRDLAGRIEFRDNLAADALLDPVPGHNAIRNFLVWAESGRQGTRLPAWLVWAVPALWVVAIVAWATGYAPSSVMGIPLLIAGWISFGSPGRTARSELFRAFGREEAFRAYPPLFQRAGSEPFDAPLLKEIRDELTTGPFAATTQMGKLARLAHLAALRSSGMLYPPVQLLTLWDAHVLNRVDAWREKAGGHVRPWFEALGRIEALSALATLAHDHPDWVYPDIHDEPLFAARSLGHPMLAAERAVANDVQVGPPGSFLLITGSNMSGKSTLLRAIGQNARLAMAGAPACAHSLSLPRVLLQTSFHVEDSLADGVSLFMAQVRRVKAIVDAARAAQERGDVMLYLMDEMLQGTNTAERRIAAARVIRHLLDSAAIGAVTTHDLEIAEDPALKEAAVLVHFRETVHPGQEPALTFDYKLRSGIATSTNALKLMEIVGLG